MYSYVCYVQVLQVSGLRPHFLLRNVSVRLCATTSIISGIASSFVMRFGINECDNNLTAIFTPKCMSSDSARGIIDGTRSFDWIQHVVSTRTYASADENVRRSSTGLVGAGGRPTEEGDRRRMLEQGSSLTDCLGDSVDE